MNFDTTIDASSFSVRGISDLISNKKIVQDYTICELAAGNCLTKSRSGGSTTRVKLKGFRDDSRFFVSAMIRDWGCFNWVKDIHAWVWGYTSLNDQVYLKVDSLARRLLLRPDQIKEAAKQGKLENLIEERAFVSDDNFIEDLQHTNEKREYTDYCHFYYNVANKYEVNKTKTLTLKSSNTNTTLTPDLLKKIISVVWNNLDSKHKKAKIKIGDQQFIVTRELNNIHIVHLDKQLIGQGTFGAVSKVLQVTNGVFKALKEPKGKADQKNIENETQMLRKMGHEVTVIGNAILMPFISGQDLNVWIKEKHTLAERIALCKRVMIAFEDMELKKEIIHGDLKPLNMRIDNQGNVHFIDFGTARPSDHYGVFSWGGWTPAYTSLEDLEVVKKATCAEERNEIDQKRDIFAIGTVLFMILSGGSAPYKFTSVYPDRNAKFDADKLLKQCGCNKELRKLIKSMVVQDPTKRIPIEQALQEWAKK